MGDSGPPPQHPHTHITHTEGFTHMAEVTPPRGKYIVIDDVFVYTTKAGDRLEIDMDLPPELVEKAAAVDAENGGDEDQMGLVVDWIGEDSRKAFDGMRVLERARFSRTFFDEFREAVQLPLGESLSSSDS